MFLNLFVISNDSESNMDPAGKFGGVQFGRTRHEVPSLTNFGSNRGQMLAVGENFENLCIFLLILAHVSNNLAINFAPCIGSWNLPKYWCANPQHGSAPNH